MTGLLRPMFWSPICGALLFGKERQGRLSTQSNQNSLALSLKAQPEIRQFHTPPEVIKQ
jgi:hypothetical protein